MPTNETEVPPQRIWMPLEVAEVDRLKAENERLRERNESSTRNAILIRQQAESAKEQSSAYDHRDRDS